MRHFSPQSGEGRKRLKTSGESGLENVHFGWSEVRRRKK
jgi:hypothetical protein